MDLESLLKAHSDEFPSGENLEYDPDFTEMELAAQPGEERQAGDQILAAEDPDYRDVAEKALVIMGRSHDLRAGIFYADAVLRTQGLPGFAEATAYVRGCLEQFWDSCHPELDEEDDNDPTMRVNSVQNLTGDTTILRGLRRAPLTDSRSFGKLCLRDIEIAEGVVSAPADAENIPDAAAISAAFQDSDDDFLAAQLAAAEAAAENIAAIDRIFDEKTPGMGPDLAPLTKVLAQIIKRLSEATGGAAGAAEAGSEPAEDAPDAPAAVAGGGFVGGINSPTDVTNALDRIIAYYHRAEPSSPVPLLLERAKRLVGADFMSIMMDMAPGGIQNVNLIGGIDDD